LAFLNFARKMVVLFNLNLNGKIPKSFYKPNFKKKKTLFFEERTKGKIWEFEFFFLTESEKGKNLGFFLANSRLVEGKKIVKKAGADRNPSKDLIEEKINLEKCQ